VKLSFKEGRKITMSMMVEVGWGGGRRRGIGVRRFFKRATSQRERSKDFNAARGKAPV
jgi:hypothetical protein